MAALRIVLIDGQESLPVGADGGLVLLLTTDVVWLVLGSQSLASANRLPAAAVHSAIIDLINPIALDGQSGGISRKLAMVASGKSLHEPAGPLRVKVAIEEPLPPVQCIRRLVDTQ